MIKVLAVDDQQLNLDILCEMLETHRIQTACDGFKAIEIAIEFQPDIVLLDVMMPMLNGLETCRRLRGIHDLQDTRIVMVSAKAMPSERAAGISAGADDYITKPFDEVEILALLRKYIDPATHSRRPERSDADDGSEVAVKSVS